MVILSTPYKIIVVSSTYVPVSLDLWEMLYWLFFIVKEPISLSNCYFYLNIQKTKIMASAPITWWQTDGETLTDFILGGSKITADGDWSHEIKRFFLFGRKL